ncbi:hypothetical protein ACFFGV_03380 [Pontibacillus salicampi]|uniref:Competence protein ComG n=1 Tax=Pontibacillus salicampi TaxID=1449801 RepID=A0ABV6LK01_9BACI
MLRNHKGFIALQSIYTFSLFLLLTLTLLPLLLLLQKEHQHLQDTRIAYHHIQDTLYDAIHDASNTYPKQSVKDITEDSYILITIDRKEGLLEGCGEWRSYRGGVARACFYAKEIS